MDIKEELAEIIFQNVEVDAFGCIDFEDEAAQAIIDYLPEFIVLSDKDKPQVGDGVYVGIDELYGTYSKTTAGEHLVCYGLSDSDYVGYLLDEIAIVKRNGLPVLIKKG